MENNNITSVTKSPNQSFEKLYLDKDYKGSIEYLLKNKQLFSSGIFHYNLGTVYSKLNEYPVARYHLEKSIQEGYINPSTINNLNFIKIKLDVSDLTNSSVTIDQAMNLATSFPFSAYSLSSLLLFFVILVIVRFRKLQSRVKIAVGLIMALLPITFYFLVIMHLHPAICLKEISLQEGPSKIFAEKGKIKAGSKIIVGDFKDGWYFVKYPESLIGWVSKEQIGLY